MRVLIVGGGVAGLTLAAKLRQQGRTPVIVEKAADYGVVGYGLGLFPLGNCVLHGLGVYDEFIERGAVSTFYELYDRLAQKTHKLDMSFMTLDAGPLVMIARADLIDLLRKACGDLPIRMATTVSQIRQESDQVSVTFDDAKTETYDLVVGCDGIHSPTRKHVCGEQPYRDTGWIAWTWWANNVPFVESTIAEYWGDRRFVGVYPEQSRAMYVVALPEELSPARGTETDEIRRVFKQHLDIWIQVKSEIGEALDAAESFFRWPMSDIRAKQWRKGRVVLCGDSATAFLPTAGVGASNAIRAAASLADELSKCHGPSVPLALELYETRVRQIVENNQQDSRNLARLMFMSGGVKTWVRDIAMRWYSPNRFIQEVRKSMRIPF